MTIEHDNCIFWPNQRGHTPCSTEYYETMSARDAIYMPGEGIGLDDLSPEDYQRWNELDNKLNELHASGHVGESERY